MENDPKNIEIDDCDLETDYEELRKKYSLPEFQSLAEDFDIEKIQDKDTIFLAREIRRTMNEKITAYIHLFETLINPTSPPMFVFKILKNMSKEEKEQIQEFYKTLSMVQLEVMKLDTVYSEEAEIKFINKNFSLWQNLKTKIRTLFDSFEKNFEKDDISKGRSYFD